MALSQKDVQNIEYIVGGLKSNIKKGVGPYGDGYLKGVGDVLRAIQLLKSGYGLTLDNIVFTCTKNDAVGIAARDVKRALNELGAVEGVNILPSKA